MKSSSSQHRKRTIRAKAATMDHQAEYDDYGPEPNMKLSHAFMVVLALHVIAVGGLFAFNKVKANHVKNSSALVSESLAAKETESTSPTSAQASTADITQTVNNILPKATIPHPIASAKITTATTTAPVKMAAVAQTAAPITTAASTAAQSATTTTGGPQQPPASSTTTMPVAAATPDAVTTEQPTLMEYTVVKGDNPYKIAKKFHVSYDALMKINNITDARKIQIGQKLKIPAAKTAKKK